LTHPRIIILIVISFCTPGQSIQNQDSIHTLPFTFESDSTCYKARIIFSVAIPSDSALHYLYDYTHFSRYSTGFAATSYEPQTDTSYIMHNEISIPFYALTLTLTRSIDTANAQMHFSLTEFSQSFPLLPQVVDVHGTYRVIGNKNDSIFVELSQQGHNEKPISWFYRRLLKNGIEKFYTSAQSYLRQQSESQSDEHNQTSGYESW